MKNLKSRLVAFFCGLTVSVACLGNIISFDNIIENASIQFVVNAQTDVPYYEWKQNDPQWNSLTLGSSGCSMGAYGCAATSVAMLIAHTGQMDGQDFDPGVFVRWMNQNGGFTNTGCILWATPSKKYDFNFKDKVTVSGSNSDKLKQIKKYYDQGYYMVVSVTSKYSGKANGHWVAIRYVDDNGAVIMDSASADYTNLFDYDGINFVCLYTSSTPANAIPYEPEPEDPFKLYSPVDIGDTVYAYVGVKQSEDSDELSYLTNRTGKLFFQDFTAFDEKQIWHFEKNSDGTYSVFTYIDDNVNALTFNSDNETLDISSYSGLNTQKFNLYQIDGYFYLNPVDTIYSMGIGSFNSITTSGENNSLKLAFANILGDTNQDYVVDYKDLLNVKKYILGLSTDISGLADVNRDGTIDFLDYIQLNHKIVG